jgi:hypothetical protein
MIIKSKSIKSLTATERAVRYVLTGHNHQVEGFVLTQNIRGDRGYKNKLKQNNNPEHTSIITEQRIGNIMTHISNNNEERQIKRNSGNVSYHEIISFHKADTEKLPNDVLLNVARTYLKKRSPHSLAVATMHSDKEFRHIHFVITSVEFATGNVVRKTRKEFKEIKVAMEQWQERELGLKHSKINHSKKKPSSKMLKFR